jgi:hypothetical protein
MGRFTRAQSQGGKIRGRNIFSIHSLDIYADLTGLADDHSDHAFGVHETDPGRLRHADPPMKKRDTIPAAATDLILA